MSPPDRYAVFGHPIRHSQSPRIHGLFAEQTRQSLTYTAEDVEPGVFEPSVRDFFRQGGRGLNCTVPLKELAFQLADTLSDRARLAKAVNTLALREDGSVHGDNTDGVGLLRDLTENLGIAISGQRLLILGAGGATRGILAPLLEHGPARITVANRTTAKALQLAQEFQPFGPVDGCGLEDIAGLSFDLILNATAASLSGELPALPEGLLAAGGCGYDLAYARAPTPFVRWGHSVGARLSVDGIGMLVEQAAEAFMLWRGVRPRTAPVIALLQAERQVPE